MSAMEQMGHGLKVSVELPAEAVDIDGRSAEELAVEFRLLWIIERVRSRCISLGKGAQLAGMDRWSFMQAMSEHGVPIIGYSVEDLRRDLATLESV